MEVLMLQTYTVGVSLITIETQMYIATLKNNLETKHNVTLSKRLMTENNSSWNVWTSNINN